MARPAVPSAILTAPHPQAAAVGGQEEEEDPEMNPRNPQRRGRHGKNSQTSPSKKRKTRNSVKEENVSITAPMVEVSRPDGVMMVFRPWTVSGKLRGEDYCRMSSNWTDETNANYCMAVAELAEAIRVAFPARVDTSRIGNCCQTREESVQDYYHRLYETFNKHSGLEEPGDRKSIWHLG
ncbi:hypothetical protein M9458_044494, partial [Cirrhinus mrigala]